MIIKNIQDMTKKLISYLNRNFAFKFFLHQVDYHTNHSTSNGYRVWFWATLAISIIFGFIRLMFMAIFGKSYYRHDLLFQTLFQTEFIDGPLYVHSINVLNVAAILNFIILFHQCDAFFWPRVHSLVVENWRKFWICNRKLKLKLHGWKFNNGKSIYKTVNIMKQLWKMKLAHIKTNYRLSVNRNLIPQTKVQIIVLLICFGILQIVVLVVSTLAALVLLVLFLLRLIANYSFVRITIALIDMAIVCYYLFTSFAVSFYMIFTLSIVCFAYSAQFDALSNFLSKYSVINNKVLPILQFFQSEHSQLLCTFLQFNYRLISKLVFVFVTCHTIFNIYQLNILLFKMKLELISIFFLLIFIVSQFFMAFCSVIVLIKISTSIHRSYKCIYQIQMSRDFVVGLDLHQKIKIDRYYEQLHSNQRFGVTAGPLGTVTIRSFCRFVAFYFTYNLLTNELIRNNLIRCK